MNQAEVAAFAAMGSLVIEALHGGTVTIGGTEYPAAIGLVPLDGMLRGGGEVAEGELLVQIRKTVMPSRPAKGTEVLANGRRWVLGKEATGEAVEAVWTLRLEPRN